MVKIRFDNTGIKLYTIINGTRYNQRELAKLLTCNPNAIYQAYKRFPEDYRKMIWILGRMFNPLKHKNKYAPCQANWGNLGSKVRNENLKGIPNGTAYDESVCSTYGGGPQTFNNGSCNRRR